MKKFFSKLSLICLVAVLGGVLSGCDLTGGKFSVSVKEVGAAYVDLEFRGPEAVEIAYILDTKEQRMENPAVIFKSGEEMTVSGGDVVRITKGIDENTQYYIYLVARLDEQNFSEVFTLPFQTSEFNFNELVTVIDRRLDGYRMRLTLPESTKQAKNAIRWNQCCLMMYNYMSSSDDYFSLLYNAGKYTTKDITLSYSEEDNWHQTGSDSDGDGEMDWDTFYNPISPGEPVVFVAGEFSWMEDSPEYETEYFKFPSGWEDGYYIPLINTDYYKGGKSQSSVGVLDGGFLKRPLDDYWTGAFQRKHFRVQEPELMDAKVEVKLANVTPVNATLEFHPEEGVHQYAFGIFDDNMYQELLKLLGGNEDYLQWAVTSYFAAYTFGTKVASGAVQADLTTFYYQSAITPETKYHVIVTAMGDSAGSKQSFTTFEFETTAKVKDAPEVEVKVVEAETKPYVAAFNIKCTTYADNPLTEAYYGANYIRDWRLAINGGSTYFGLVNGNNAFQPEELEKINSEEGYTIYIPSVDGETTRLVVVGYNDEYTPNNVSGYEFIEDCPAVADCTTPYATAKEYVDEDYYIDLVGDWTAEATLTNAEGTKTYDHTSKITIAGDLYSETLDYPETLSKEVYDLYEKEEYDNEEVDAMWYEFNKLAEEITERRLKDQNRLVGIGWLDDDSYDRLDARTPYDLFVATDYTSVDVSSLYNDYGPKWYIETSVDENGNIVYSVPFDSNLLPPSANWSIPTYLSALEKDTWQAVTYGDGWNASFPVTVSEDHNKITIHPLVLEDGTKMYPNMIGIDPTMGTILENPVISEIILTRGWSGSDNKQSSVRHAGQSAKVNGDFPKGTYKKMTKLVAPAQLQKMEVEVVGVEQFHENAKRYIENYFNQNN